jgi:TonB family protein
VTSAILATRALPHLVEPRRERPAFFQMLIPPRVPQTPSAPDHLVPAVPWPPPLGVEPLVVPPPSPVELSHGAGPLDVRSLVDRPVGETPTSGVGGAGAEARSPTSDALTAAEVDEPLMVLKQAWPQYPRTLAEAGISGQVALEFVVDTSGAVELSSLHVLMSSDPRFDEAARRTIRDTRFRPARRAGVPVRQLVRQTVRFVATP